MRLRPAHVCLVLLPFAICTADAAEPIRSGRNGTLELGGRLVRCENVRLRLDRSLPNLGAAIPGQRLLLLNPAWLGRYSPTVQLFVFHHECGHHSVGGDELKADCWSVEQGVREGWLDAKGLKEACASFANAPATSTHPSGRRRCQNLDGCFAAATALVERARVVARPQSRATAAPPAPPLLVTGPTLVRSSAGR